MDPYLDDYRVYSSRTTINCRPLIRDTKIVL
jgi:hypothetical protein